MILDSFRVTDQVAIVTGAGHGIGRAIAVALAEAGAHVVAAARTQKDIDETAAQVSATGRTGVAGRRMPSPARATRTPFSARRSA